MFHVRAMSSFYLIIYLRFLLYVLFRGGFFLLSLVFFCNHFEELQTISLTSIDT